MTVAIKAFGRPMARDRPSHGGTENHVKFTENDRVWVRQKKVLTGNSRDGEMLKF